MLTVICNNHTMKDIPYERSFASHEKSKFWSEKNKENPRNVSKYSNKKYWFECHNCEHLFDISLSHINSGKWCSFCASKKLCNNNDCQTCFNKSFASYEKSIYWSNKNTETPRDLFKGTHNKYWFDCCNCNHSFDSGINSIVKGIWCSFCAGKKLCNDNDCQTCFNKSFASYEKSIYWSKTNTEKPRDLFKGNTQNKYWFDCYNCNHSFDSIIADIVQGSWCSFCCNPPKRLCNNNDCQNCFNNSFTSHPKAEFWSEKNTENPRYVFKSSNNKYWFDCSVCDHSFDSVLASIVNGNWCPYCSNKRLCNNNQCQTCFNNSFASHPKAEFWSEKNTENPRYVFKSSHNKYWFVCSVCDHSFDSGLNSIVGGSWCSFCSNNRLCNNHECNYCFNKSFASYEKSKYWSDKNTEKPRSIFKSSNYKYWFDCPDCIQPYYSRLNAITKGHWCSCRKHKTEKKLYDILKNIYPTLIRQFNQEWCKNKRYLPFDFCIPEHKIIIELDGPQHFQQVSNWCSPEEQFENDLYKEKCANDNNYSVIRLLQEDVLNDTYDWLKDLCNTIEEIKNGDEIINIYLCKNGEYESF